MRLRGDRLSWREIDGEIVALDLVSSTYFTANSTATVLIRALADGADRDGLVKALVDEFDVDEPNAQAGVESFIQEMRERDLLEPEAG